jgi:hypothetical protein
VLHVVIDAIVGHESRVRRSSSATCVDFVITIARRLGAVHGGVQVPARREDHVEDVWVGALVTAVLFKVGQIVGWRSTSNHGATSAYGTFGSIVAVLLWAYYSSIIMFFGAEFTQVWATSRPGDPAGGARGESDGGGPRPGRHPQRQRRGRQGRERTAAGRGAATRPR